MTPRSDVVAAVLLGIATFSKPTNILLIGPVLGVAGLAPAVACGRSPRVRCFGAVVGGLFAWNVAITGRVELPGRRGSRHVLQHGSGRSRARASAGSRFRPTQHSFDTTGMIRETNRVPVEVLTTGDALLHVFRRNLGVFLLRSPHRFRAVLLSGRRGHRAVLVGARQRPLWQWMTLAAGLGSAMALILYMPYSYSGGGGPVGNRYFLGVYPVFLFVMPPLTGLSAPIVAVAGRRHLHGAARHQSVHRVFPTGGACEERTVSLAAGGDDAAQRSADERDAAEGQAAAGRGAAGVGLLP